MDTNPINTRNRKRRNAEGSHIDFRVLEELLVAENRLQDGDNQLLFCPEKAELHRSGRNSAKAPDRPTLPRTMLFSSYSNSVLQATSFADLGLVAQDLQHIFSPGKGNGAWWLDVQNPSEKTVRQLCASFGVHHLTVEDIVTGECGEKIEDFSLYYFTCIRSFQAMEVESHVEYEPYNVYMVVFEEGTLSFSFTQSDHSAHICDRIEVLKDYVQISSDWFFYALM
jgi:magnesium transporter